MPNKTELLNKLFRKSIPRNFTVKELDELMAACNCTKGSGGRGSAIMYIHKGTLKKLVFDGPHPQKELYFYQIKLVKAFIKDIGEI